jgi:hypothetical protein
MKEVDVQIVLINLPTDQINGEKIIVNKKPFRTRIFRVIYILNYVVNIN